MAGQGSLEIDESGSGYLCRALPHDRLVAHLPGNEPKHKCSDISVPVEGLFPRGIRGLTTDGRSYWASIVDVAGIWTGMSLVADSALVRSPVSLRPEQSPGPDEIVPCNPPEGGWLAGPPSIPTERALSQLGAIVNGDPTAFSGFWLRRTKEGATVAVVGALNPSADLRKRLADAYSFPLCIAAVDRSLNDLWELAGSVKQVPGVHAAEVYPEVPVVRAQVAVLDAGLEERIAALGGPIELDPLLAPDPTPGSGS
jgi:hypothetical protein